MDLQRDALERISAFPWPGNIRQLKNFVEQISILEKERYLSAQIIEKYLPDLPGTQIAFMGNEKENFGSFHERELLYKFLFDIKREVSELKGSIVELLHNLNVGQTQTAPSTQSAPINLNTKLLGPVSTPVANMQPIPAVPHYEQDHHEWEHVEGEEITDHKPVESLSLQQQEKEMIKNALNRHHGKRKIAAQELGISERTLYRKIKEYNLEDL
jgi:DNA-binding NtrC family response regulator